MTARSGDKTRKPAVKAAATATAPRRPAAPRAASTPPPSPLIGPLSTLAGAKAADALLLGWAEDEAAQIKAALKASRWTSGEPEAKAAHDLVVAGPGAWTGPTVAQARDRAAAITAAVAPGGVLLAVIDTLAAPAGTDGLDALLFPALAAAGDLGEAARDRPPLAAASWLLLLRSLGLTVEDSLGWGARTPTSTAVARHGPRLGLFDDREVATPRLWVRAVRPGGRS